MLLNSRFKESYSDFIRDPPTRFRTSAVIDFENNEVYNHQQEDLSRRVPTDRVVEFFGVEA